MMVLQFTQCGDRSPKTYSGDDAYALVKEHDLSKIAPAGDVIRAMLQAGQSFCYSMKYSNTSGTYAAALPVHDSTLQRQAKDFFQNLTVELANSDNAVTVYSLQWSGPESLGNVALRRS